MKRQAQTKHLVVFHLLITDSRVSLYTNFVFRIIFCAKYDNIYQVITRLVFAKILKTPTEIIEVIDELSQNWNKQDPQEVSKLL